MSLLDSLSKGYKGGSKSSPAPKLIPQSKPSPTITSEQMVEIEKLVAKEKAEFKPKSAKIVSQNRVNTLNSGYKK
jgi:hypothetical protein